MRNTNPTIPGGYVSAPNLNEVWKALAVAAQTAAASLAQPAVTWIPRTKQN